ncbi:carboxymuconolactone decarboxylase family protein [Cupriavidus plantarum]|uniref:carboxymuconolactone decarboxylase family protein n=1 Tax=Cupriavidus plantarum TaxID=942865 RepID=UPI0015CA7D93|nr:carboxymuconolactone decarboxylase family protein [Cupriavidus plantarum]NYI02766.1 4-carboxymuconolactone decarboxylase [Cupriavidus plantarum]
MSNDRAAARAAIAQRRNGVVGAVFETLLERPAVAQAASDIGLAIRFSGCLPAPLRELAICTVAAHWRTEHEWKIHADLALKAGVDAALLDALEENLPLPSCSAEQHAVHAFITELLHDGRAAVATRDKVLELLDRPQAVELAAIAGYYSLLSFAMNTF